MNDNFGYLMMHADRIKTDRDFATWRTSPGALTLFAFIALIKLILCSPALADDALRRLAKENFGELAAPVIDESNSVKVDLGRALFWDPRISAGGKTSCASCHRSEDGGADRRQFSVRAKGNLTGRNSQTVFNSTLQPALRWIGDRRSAAHQAERSITGSLGLESPEAAVAKLRELGYEESFAAAFADQATPLSVARFGQAIEAYEQTLITPAPLDRFLAGDDGAISADQKVGLRLFVSIGCADCHHGALLGGNSFEKFGVTQDYWLATGSNKKDQGRFLATESEDDKYRFRVAMLRNISETAPYFHDGTVSTLAKAVSVMAKVQLGVELTPAEREPLIAFLRSLTGEIPENFSPTDD